LRSFKTGQNLDCVFKAWGKFWTVCRADGFLLILAQVPKNRAKKIFRQTTKKNMKNAHTFLLGSLFGGKNVLRILKTAGGKIGRKVCPYFSQHM